MKPSLHHRYTGERKHTGRFRIVSADGRVLAIAPSEATANEWAPKLGGTVETNR